MLFYSIGALLIASSIFFIVKDMTRPFLIKKDFIHIQQRILTDEDLFVEEQNQRQSKMIKGEYLSPTLGYEIKHVTKNEFK